MQKTTYIEFDVTYIEKKRSGPSVRPSVCLCVTLFDRFDPDLSQFDVITSILRNLRETIYTEGSKGPPRPAGVI